MSRKGEYDIRVDSFPMSQRLAIAATLRYLGEVGFGEPEVLLLQMAEKGATKARIVTMDESYGGEPGVTYKARIIRHALVVTGFEVQVKTLQIVGASSLTVRDRWDLVPSHWYAGLIVFEHDGKKYRFNWVCDGSSITTTKGTMLNPFGPQYAERVLKADRLGPPLEG